MASTAPDVVMSDAAADVAATLAYLPEHAPLLRKLLVNVVNEPNEVKYRRLKLSNAKIGAMYATPEAKQALEAVGWQLTLSGDALELPATADLDLLARALRPAEGETWPVTVMRGPLRSRLLLPASARLAHLSMAIELCPELRNMPRGRQRVMAGYPPHLLSDNSRTLQQLGIKTVMLEDHWEQLVSDMRGFKASFVEVAAALDCPCLRVLADENQTFMLDRARAMLTSRCSEMPVEEVQGARRCLSVLWPPTAATHAARLAFCTEAVGSSVLHAARRGRDDDDMDDVDEFDDQQGLEKFVLTVDRACLFQSAIAQVSKACRADLQRPLEVRFEGEAAEDAGGLRREFFNEFGRACPSCDGLWQLTPAGSLVPVLAPVAEERVPSQAQRHQVYRSCGRVLGLALRESARPPQQPLLFGLPLSRSLVRCLQGSFARSLAELQDDLNAEQHHSAPDYRGAPAFCTSSLAELGLEGQLTFSYALPGGTACVDLLPEGHSQVVTDQTKQRWLEATLRYELIDGLREAADSLRAGILDMAGPSHLVLLSAQEISEAWSGRGDVTDKDLHMWQEQTDISPAVKKQAEWFFELLRGDLREARARVLKFCTGSDRWPANPSGFKFVVEPRDGGDETLPSAMTCGNMLQLPRYRDRELLRQRLLQACDWGLDLHLK